MKTIRFFPGKMYLALLMPLYLGALLFDTGLTMMYIHSPWQEGNLWVRFLMLAVGQWALVFAATIEALIIVGSAYHLAKHRSNYLAICLLAVPVMIHVGAGLTWLPWTGLRIETVIQLQLVGSLILVSGLAADLVTMKMRKARLAINNR